VGGAQEAQGGTGLRSIVLGECGEVDGSIPQERTEQGGSQQRQIARASGVAAQFGIFAPSDIAAIMVRTFHAPMAAASAEPLAGREGSAFCGGDEQAGFAAEDAGFLMSKLTLHRDDRGGMRKAKLQWGDRRERQVAVLGAAMVAVVGRKRGALPWSACAAAACTAEALPLS